MHATQTLCGAGFTGYLLRNCHRRTVALTQLLRAVLLWRVTHWRDHADGRDGARPSSGTHGRDHADGRDGARPSSGTHRRLHRR